MQSQTRRPSALAENLAGKGVEFMLASYVDMHGVSKGKVVPIAHLRDMLGGSELCTGAALDGVPQDVSDEEVAAFPDPAVLHSCCPGRRKWPGSRATSGARASPSSPAAATS